MNGVVDREPCNLFCMRFNNCNMVIFNFLTLEDLFYEECQNSKSADTHTHRYTANNGAV